VGVQAGDTSFQLLAALPELHTLYCVDAWRCYPDYEHDHCPSDKTGGEWPSDRLLEEAAATFFRRLGEEGHGGRVIVLPMYSREAASLVADESLDFVFLDANHSYEYTREDIGLWMPKVRPGGLLAGHDYGNPHNSAWGITRAVDEAFPHVETGTDFTWWVWRDGAKP